MMAQKFFGFGEPRAEYAVPVLNERAVRASAGILFAWAMVAFMYAWVAGNFQPTRIFVLLFLTDFTIRLFVNPKFSPSFIVGSWVVRGQQPEWVGASQKRFAWGIGWVLAEAMTYLIVYQGVVGPINVVICRACLILMFFETAFGICLGCKVYQMLRREDAQLCPGAVCDPNVEKGASPQALQWAALGLFLVLGYGVVMGVKHYASNAVQAMAHQGQHVHEAAAADQEVAEREAAEKARCTVPEFAKRIGHEEMWKKHNHCE